MIDAPDTTGSTTASNTIHWQRDAKTDSAPIIKFGFWSIGAAFLIFLIWASFFQLSSAVVTLGTVTSDGRNKMVQHPTGGRVRAIRVLEGALVAQGQPLLELDAGVVRAELTQMEARLASLTALKARLDAQRSGGERGMARRSNVGGTTTSASAVQTGPKPMVLGRFELRGTEAKRRLAPRDLPLAGGNVVGLRGIAGNSFILPATNLAGKPAAEAPPAFDREIFASERAAFEANRRLMSEQMAALQRKIDTLQQKRRGLLARVRSQRTLLSMHRRELARMRPLAREGYVARNRLNEREGTILELEGTVTSLELDAVGVEHQIEEVRVEMRKVSAESAEAASQQYAKIIGELAELSDKLIAARAAVKATTIRAPIAGRVTKLSTTTVGGVIGGGEVIGEIVPKDAPLLVQARVEPADIDYVDVGSTAQIVITAFSRTLDDTLDGKVVYVAPDSEIDEKTGNRFFIVRLSVAASKTSGHGRLSDVQPGMQAEVYINTGARTFMSYLARPLTDSFKRAFRER